MRGNTANLHYTSSIFQPSRDFRIQNQGFLLLKVELDVTGEMKVPMRGYLDTQAKLVDLGNTAHFDLSKQLAPATL